MIYGITGKKQAGKDTLAKALKLENPKFVVLHFADHLKALCADIFGLGDYQLNDSIGKEEDLPQGVDMDQWLYDMEEATGLKIVPAGCIATTPRELMQYFGAEYVRAAQDDYWIEQTINTARKFIHKGKDIVIPDSRFLNECTAIREAGGRIIRIIRRAAPVSKIGINHTSEVEMDKITPDFEYAIDNGDLMRFNEVAKELLNVK